MVKPWSNRATSELNMIDAATNLDFLRIPPSNHLESLKGDRADHHSIAETEPRFLPENFFGGIK